MQATIHVISSYENVIYVKKKKNERPITLSVPGGESQYTILAPCASQAAINSTSTIHVCGDMNE